MPGSPAQCDCRLIVTRDCPGSILLRVGSGDTVTFADKTKAILKISFQFVSPEMMQVQVSAFVINRFDGEPDGWIVGDPVIDRAGDTVEIASGVEGLFAKLELLGPPNDAEEMRRRTLERARGWTGRWGQITTDSAPS